NPLGVGIPGHRAEIGWQSGIVIVVQPPELVVVILVNATVVIEIPMKEGEHLVRTTLVVLREKTVRREDLIIGKSHVTIAVPVARICDVAKPEESFDVVFVPKPRVLDKSEAPSDV